MAKKSGTLTPNRKLPNPEKYCSEIVQVIVDKVSTDTYSVPELCKIAKISKSTYYGWLIKYPEFKLAVSDAEKERDAALLVSCQRSLKRLIEGYIATDTETKDAPNGVTTITRTREVGPSLGAIIHFQTNKDPDVWANSQGSEEDAPSAIDIRIHTVVDEKKTKPEPISE